MIESAADFDNLWDYDDPAGSETRFRELLPQLPRGDSAYIQLLTQIGRAQGLQRHFDDAHATLEEAQALLPAGPSRARARYLLERGRVYNSAGRRAEARSCFGEALAVAKEAGLDYEAVDAAHMLAIVAPPDQHLAWNLRALHLAEGAADEQTRGWLPSLYNNTGWSYHDLGDYEQALGYFEKALAARETAGQLRPIRIARWCVARTFRSLGRLHEALALQNGLRAAYEADGERPGYVYEELAELHLLFGDQAEARSFFALAYEQLSQDPWLAEQQPERLERLRLLSEL